jgi:serine phosphatase RsbU (regulator of sigma subunit)
VRWGGDPEHKAVVVEPTGTRLGPRASFAEYVETVRGSSAPWSAVDEDAARQLGRHLRASVTRRAERDRSVASLMQQALLLDSVPVIPGVDIAALYRPAHGDSLGGDWYDVFFLPDGRAVVALGDVAGHGMAVASTMAQVRHTLRAYVLREETLAGAISRLNELCRDLLPGEMATLVVALLDPVARTLEIVNAGHLPPVIGGAPTTTRFADLARSPALGISTSSTYSSTVVTLDAGERIVLYTDGLIERRRVGLDEQLDRLVSLLDDAPSTSSAALCELLDLGFGPDGSDDVTVMALRFPEDT